MAQTNYTPISLYYSATATNVPTAGNLVAGELALNTADGKLFYKDSAGVVQTLASKDTNSGTFTNISVSGVASFADGTVLLPSITNIGDTNTGIYFPAADTIAFTEGGVESMRIDASGNVGIGTNTPSTFGKLAVYGTSSGGQVVSAIVNSSGTANTQAVLSFDTSASGFNVRDSQIRATNNGSNQTTLEFYTSNAVTPAEAMRITAPGNVGIGTSSPSTKFQVNGAASTNNTSRFVAKFTDTSAVALGNGGGIMFQGVYTGTTALDCSGIQAYKENATDGNYAYAMTFATRANGGNLTEQMRIASNGIVTMSAYGAGAATFSAAGVISSVSDETWKIKDGVPTNPDAMLQKLEAGYWFYNEEKAPIFGQDRQLGFYAQNVHEAIGEEAAPTPEEGKPWGYYDRSVLAITVMSLKNALSTIEDLKQRIAALENK